MLFFKYYNEIYWYTSVSLSKVGHRSRFITTLLQDVLSGKMWVIMFSLLSSEAKRCSNVMMLSHKIYLLQFWAIKSQSYLLYNSPLFLVKSSANSAHKKMNHLLRNTVSSFTLFAFAFRHPHKVSIFSHHTVCCPLELIPLITCGILFSFQFAPFFFCNIIVHCPWW